MVSGRERISVNISTGAAIDNSTRPTVNHDRPRKTAFSTGKTANGVKYRIDDTPFRAADRIALSVRFAFNHGSLRDWRNVRRNSGVFFFSEKRKSKRLKLQKASRFYYSPFVLFDDKNKWHQRR